MLRHTFGTLRAGKDLQAQISRLRRRSDEELRTLSPPFRMRVERVVRELEAMDWMPVVFHGERTTEEQAEKVKKGYSKTMNSFHVEGAALQRRHNGVSWTIKGEAADIVDARYLWSGPAASIHFKFWRDLGFYAKIAGLEWGGDWKTFKDVAHVQMTLREFHQDIRDTRASRTA